MEAVILRLCRWSCLGRRSPGLYPATALALGLADGGDGNGLVVGQRLAVVERHGGRAAVFLKLQIIIWLDTLLLELRDEAKSMGIDVLLNGFCRLGEKQG